MSEQQGLAMLQPLDDGPGPARPISDARARELVRGALRRVIAGDVDLPGPAARTRARRLTRVALVAGGLLAVGAAVAGLAYRRLVAERPAVVATATATTTTAAPLPAPAERTDRAPATGPEAAPDPSAAVAAATNGDHDATTATRSPVRHKATPPRPRALAHSERENAAASGDDLLARANQLRAQRRWREAAAAYQSVIAGSAGTNGAYVAMLARAELLLDHLNRPSEALGLFQRALAQPSGLLTEEARYGIATCYRALGDSNRERQALNAFLAAHPHSLLRASAAARLTELR